MAYAIGADDLPVSYSPRLREWGIQYRDGVSINMIEYCPWCGKKLPKDLRDEWVERAEKLGLSLWDVEDHPEKFPPEMLDDRWWKEAGL
ncbi:hypothetical protein TH66_04725 [Carbonactinospora thermoautotrophica]|nr:hypothetical protein [Carbonactinospora thermoautotrophica]KWX05156.1 hypothetical protein TH66_04725 [Carbonactinospora thermoautotrophica]KWX06080.1 hypothetical protein TR74_23110 [Carbonactinospora thermoautotrophica]